MSEENFIFKAGDHVKYLPMGDEVFILKKWGDWAGNSRYPLCINIKKYTIGFTKDGKEADYHKLPSIELVHRPEENKDTSGLEERLKNAKELEAKVKKLAELLDKIVFYNTSWSINYLPYFKIRLKESVKEASEYLKSIKGTNTL